MYHRTKHELYQDYMNNLYISKASLLNDWPHRNFHPDWYKSTIHAWNSAESNKKPYTVASRRVYTVQENTHKSTKYRGLISCKGNSCLILLNYEFSSVQPYVNTQTIASAASKIKLLICDRLIKITFVASWDLSKDKYTLVLSIWKLDQVDNSFILGSYTICIAVVLVLVEIAKILLWVIIWKAWTGCPQCQNTVDSHMAC